ncbi:MAG: deoxyhypusine synthase family protein [Candidatus Aenigmatarchaeota archaeon]
MRIEEIGLVVGYKKEKIRNFLEMNSSILSKIKEGEYATFELLEEIGKRIKKDSILRTAFNNEVKIIVPGIIDSILEFKFGCIHKIIS